MTLDTITAQDVKEGDEILIERPYLGQFHSAKNAPDIDQSTFAARVTSVTEPDTRGFLFHTRKLHLHREDSGNGLPGIPDDFTVTVDTALSLLRAHTGWRHKAFEDRQKLNTHNGNSHNGDSTNGGTNGNGKNGHGRN